MVLNFLFAGSLQYRSPHLKADIHNGADICNKFLGMQPLAKIEI